MPVSDYFCGQHAKNKIYKTVKEIIFSKGAVTFYF